MDFDTYIINLQKDADKYTKLSNALNKAEIKHERFDAIYGKELDNRYDNYFTSYKPFIPKSCIGCGLSHYFVAKQHFEKDNKKVALIFEDDAVLKFENKADIDKIIEQAPQDWEIILLYTQGVTNYNSDTWHCGPIAGSNIAYLINQSGFEKLYKDCKFYCHVDIYRVAISRNNDFKVYKTPKMMVIPDDANISSTSTNCARRFDEYIDSFYADVLESELTGYTASMAVKYKLIRIPFIGYELDFIQLFILISILNILLFTLFGKKKLHSFLFSTFYYIVLFVSIVIFLKYYLLLLS